MRKHIYFDQKINDDVCIFIKEIMNADIAYFNGILIGQTGQLPPHFKSGWGKVRCYKIPAEIIRKGDNVIALRVYYNSESWITGPIQILKYNDGKIKQLIYDFFFIDLIESFSILLLAIALFFIMFYFKRNKEIENLYFGLACISMAIALSLHYIENKYTQIPLSSNTILIFSQTGLIAFPPFLSLFLHQYIKGNINKYRLALTLLVPVIALSLMVLSGTRHSMLQIRNIFLGIIAYFIIDAIVLSAIQFKNKNKKASMFIFAMIPLFLFGIHDILAFGFKIFPNSIPLYIYGMPVLLFVIGTFLIYRFVNSLNEAEQLNLTLSQMTRSFARFVPVEFLKQLNKQNIIDVMLGDAVLIQMTVLFLDIRNFTGISEKMKPEEILSFLNNVLNNFEPVITQHNGIIDKFIGDAIMALYSNRASMAIRSALLMRYKLKEYNSYRQKSNYDPIDFGIGINTGDVVLGTVGSDTRMDTTVIGDTVNMSERMEELTKIYKVPIIISENSFNALEKSDEFCIRKIDKVKFLGKTIPITVYEVFDCDDDRIKDMKRNMFNQFNEAIDLYLLGKFNDAYKLLNEYVKIFPHDAVANLYVKRLGLLMDKSVKQWPGYTVVR